MANEGLRERLIARSESIQGTLSFIMLYKADLRRLLQRPSATSCLSSWLAGCLPACLPNDEDNPEGHSIPAPND